MGTRGETRYAFCSQPSVTVRLALPSGEYEELEAQLVDISRGGVKLVLDDDVQIGGTVVLRFHLLNVDLGAKVCWSRLGPDDACWAACLFDPALPAELLELLLDQGYLERRRHPREEIHIPAQASWHSGETHEVGIRDYSPGGLCLWVPQPAKRAERLLLEVGNEDEASYVLVAVMWQIKFDEGYLIGCSFLNRQGLSAIHRLIRQQTPSALEPERFGRLRGSFGRLVSLFKGSSAQ